jgi:outer membrane protein assembly factor BamB
VFLGPGYVQAQFRAGPDWVTAGGDAHRSAWIRTDPKISADRLRAPGFQLVWKIKLNHEPGPAATLSRYIGYRGFRSLGYVGSATGEITAMDIDLGRVEWNKTVRASAAPGAGSSGCSETMPEITRATTSAFPGQAGRGGAFFPGRSGPAKSGVGEPDGGAVILQEIAARAAADAARGGMARGPGGFGFPRTPSYLDVLSSDGMLHRMYVSNGEEPAPPIPFLDRNANAHGLIVIDNVAYAATSHGCGGVPSGVWALDLVSKRVAHWTANGDIAGEDGPAFGPDGTVYAATTAGDLVALAPKTLELKATYRAGGQAFLASPTVFEHKSKTMIAAASADSRLHIVDAESLKGEAYSAAVTGALTSWEDLTGTRWIAAPSKDSITAWKLVDESGATALKTGWTSREMISPLPPLVINGVLFGVSNSTAPVVYALDAATGNPLWNSGRTIVAPVRNGRLTGSDMQIYLGTSDGTIYAFGFPIEH